MLAHAWKNWLRHTSRNSKRFPLVRTHKKPTPARLELERLEDRLAPTIDFQAFASSLSGPLSALEQRLESALNTSSGFSQLPFVGQQLGNIDKAHVLTSDVITQISNSLSALNEPSPQ